MPPKIDDVVDEQAGLAGDIADDIHDFQFAGALAALVDDGERRIDAFGECPCAHDAADIGRDDHQIVERHSFLDVAHHHRRREEIIGRNIEEALDLAGVKIDSQHPIGSCMGDHIGHKLGRNRCARPRLAVLPRVAEIRNDRGDPPRRGPAQRIGHDQNLHEVVIGREGRQLDDECVLAADILLDFDEDLHIGKAADLALGQRTPI